MQTDASWVFARREELLEETLGMIRRIRAWSFAPGRGRSPSGGLSAVQHSTLHFAIRRPGAIQQDLARYLGIQRSHVSEVVKSLERRGLLRRLPDDSDRRLNHLEITPLGSAIHSRFHESHSETLPRLFRNWTDEDIESLHSLFQRLERPEAGQSAGDARKVERRVPPRDTAVPLAPAV
jgi:DNA-binding MarR family transcriptional regulator